MEFLIGLVVLVLDVYAIYQTLTSSASTLAKAAWTIAIILLPVLGVLVWLIAGPRGRPVRT